MADHIQILRRIGACENSQAQPDWKGPAILPCSEPPAYLCETCGFLLCGAHAGGHWHPTSDAATVPSHYQGLASAAQEAAKSAAENASALQAQLTAAQADSTRVAKIKALLAS